MRRWVGKALGAGGRMRKMQRAHLEGDTHSSESIGGHLSWRGAKCVTHSAGTYSKHTHTPALGWRHTLPKLCALLVEVRSSHQVRPGSKPLSTLEVVAFEVLRQRPHLAAASVVGLHPRFGHAGLTPPPHGRRRPNRHLRPLRVATAWETVASLMNAKLFFGLY